MNRRAFLRSLVAAPIAVPVIASQQLAAAPAPQTFHYAVGASGARLVEIQRWGASLQQKIIEAVKRQKRREPSW